MVIPTYATSLADTLSAFAAGHEVPGSGSANALVAAIATALVASVATKTHDRASEAKYRPISDAAGRIAVRAQKLSAELVELGNRDAIAFRKVVALRRQAKTLREQYDLDQALRAEIASTKPATDIPLRIAAIALEVADSALLMYERGFMAARGESYSAFVTVLAAADGSIYVAKRNIHDIARKANELNDPGYERPWLRVIKRRADELSARALSFHDQMHALLVAERARATSSNRKRKRSVRSS